jgi:hypothetical protein
MKVGIGYELNKIRCIVYSIFASLSSSWFILVEEIEAKNISRIETCHVCTLRSLNAFVLPFYELK